MLRTSCERRSVFWTVAAGALLAPTILGMSGCSNSAPKKETGTVKGTVTIDGEPLSEGIVAFQSSELGAGAQAKLTSDGTFKFDAPLEVGEYVVCIMPPEPEGAINRPDPKLAENIPEKYRTVANSDLRATVEIGENEFPFEMQKK